MAEVKTDIKQSDEWQKAVAYEILDSDIERQRQLIGVWEAMKTSEYVQTASHDSIRNWAYGCGDDNPLFVDPNYARKTRWGGVIAPGMMVGQVSTPMRGDPPSAEVKALKKSLFKGIHVFVSGADWNFYRPLRPGDAVYTFGGELTCEVKQSEFAGRSVIMTSRRVKVNQRAEVIATYDVLRVLTERKTAATKGKYSAIEPATYTDEEFRAIEEIYAAETVQGAKKRRFEDVEKGDSLGTQAKGPLTVTDVICFHAGGYGFSPYAPTANRRAHKNRQRIPAFYVKNEHGIPDVAQRLHWDPVWAQAIGNPMAYDYGVMRENYLWQYLNDWAGDDAVITSLHDEVRKFNYMGDVQHVTGEVLAKRTEHGNQVVDVAVKFTNQRGEETVRGTATIALPSNARPLPLYPTVPDELADQAARLMARHWEMGGD
ncbi:MaoC family dehydratase N-terminal domain-containing protein [Novosphingobium sp. Gsoil 351]|uniref:FAS1-like dehydratase domain-containing protein n=1 Tax=Novosphingobium sp. Gsoil 351 TaxID=2675225 RepID=UPI0012B49963|nr:MaoC family dehydratase N-terminal domain-containing protein [Novosphingobium sp. Gsoil 351]QGN54205.1 acyl dehydratase [Novosphingobium sp. Gsoil 351]